MMQYLTRPVFAVGNFAVSVWMVVLAVLILAYVGRKQGWF